MYTTITDLPVASQMFEIDPVHLEAAAKSVQECMENAVELSLPMPVKVSAGNSWGSLVGIRDFLASMD